MVTVDDSVFNDLIAEAIDELPDRYTANLNNVLITYDDDPSPEQRAKSNLRDDQTLFGLYEGVPLVARGNGYNMAIPDRITIFKNPMLRVSSDLSELKSQIKHTLWHEIAHYYGLNHESIHRIESNWS